MVIHTIFNPGHNEILSICVLTKLQWYACDYVQLIVYIMRHSTNLNANYQMHYIVCWKVIVRFQAHTEVHSWLHATVHAQPASFMLATKPTRHSHVHSEYIRTCTSEYTLNITPKSTWWHTASLIDCVLQSKLSRHFEAHL